MDCPNFKTIDGVYSHTNRWHSDPSVSATLQAPLFDAHMDRLKAVNNGSEQDVCAGNIARHLLALDFDQMQKSSDFRSRVLPLMRPENASMLAKATVKDGLIVFGESNEGK